jgi:hypothetical protein
MIHRFDEEELGTEIHGSTLGLTLPTTREFRARVALCAARHLAVAAFELAHDPALPPEESHRFSLAESRFRALTDHDGTGLDRHRPDTTPFVRLEDGTAVPVTELLVTACQHTRFRLPARSIDHDLVHEAKELLCGLRWLLPFELEEAEPGVASGLPRRNVS